MFYYILRRFFVKLHFSDKEIRLEKGLLIKRAAVLPISAAVKINVRRTPLMRIFRAKEVTIFTLCGKPNFFLSENETLPFLPEQRGHFIKPRFRDVAFGAFIDTRALGGLFVFAAVLRRISAIFGSEYFDRAIAVLTKTADDLEKALDFFHIAVPRIALLIGVFALGSWAFAYMRKLLRLARFRVLRSGGLLFVKSGVFTLYEHALVPHSAALRCETITSLATRRAPLYLRGEMICPCVRREMLPKTLRILCGLNVPQNRLSSPKRAFLGHIVSPLSWLGVLAAALFAVYRLDYSKLLKTALYSGIIVDIYAIALYLLYMGRSGIAFGEGVTSVSARRGLRLYTAVFTDDIVKQISVSQSVFQRRSGLCGYKLSLTERRKITARQLPKKELLRRIPF